MTETTTRRDNDLTHWKKVWRLAGDICSVVAMGTAFAAVVVKMTTGAFPYWIAGAGVLFLFGIVTSAATGRSGGGWDPGRLG